MGFACHSSRTCIKCTPSLTKLPSYMNATCSWPVVKRNHLGGCSPISPISEGLQSLRGTQGLTSELELSAHVLMPKRPCAQWPRSWKERCKGGWGGNVSSTLGGSGSVAETCVPRALSHGVSLAGKQIASQEQECPPPQAPSLR